MSLNESRLSLGGLGIGHINLLAPSATQQPLNIIEDSKLSKILYHNNVIRGDKEQAEGLHDCAGHHTDHTLQAY
jgi:hypothetical protein